MVIKLANADFSQNNIGKIRLNETIDAYTASILTHMTRFSASSDEAFALDDFYYALTTSGVWDKLWSIHIPVFANDLSEAFYDIKKQSVEAFANNTSKIETLGASIEMDSKHGVKMKSGVTSKPSMTLDGGPADVRPAFYSNNFSAIIYSLNELRKTSSVHALCNKVVTKSSSYNGVSFKDSNIAYRARFEASEGTKDMNTVAVDSGFFAVTALTDSYKMYVPDAKKTISATVHSAEDSTAGIFNATQPDLSESSDVELSLGALLITKRALSDAEMATLQDAMDNMMNELGISVVRRSWNVE